MTHEDTEAIRETASRQILRIRIAAGNPCTTCPTCGRLATDPYRGTGFEYTAGGVQVERLAQGCIDACHTPYLQSRTSGSSAWHFRPEAVELRRRELAHLRSLITAPFTNAPTPPTEATAATTLPTGDPTHANPRGPSPGP